LNLLRIEADRLRNLRAIELELGPGLTVLHGRNGQGKTSLLEAVYMLGTGRSFRTRRLDDTISWEGGPLRVAGEVQRAEWTSRLAVIADGPERRLLVDKVEKDLESYLGRLLLVDLTGPRMEVLKGAPEERRRFLDRGIVALEPAYLRSLGEYRRVLQQRNALLKSGGQRASPELLRELGAWDERLITAAERIHRRRREYAGRLQGCLRNVASVLFPDGQELRMRYQPSPAATGKTDPGEFGRVFAEALAQRRGRDLGLGFTTDGPHRDELIAELDGVDLRRFGSAGQLRSAVIAFKLAKLERIHEERGEPPLFLMDDFDSDLDEVRAQALATHLHEGGFQTLVATSKTTLVDTLHAPLARVRVAEGTALPA
jgi:DNA replication and repair protein RecF